MVPPLHVRRQPRPALRAFAAFCSVLAGASRPGSPQEHVHGASTAPGEPEGVVGDVPTPDFAAAALLGRAAAEQATSVRFGVFHAFRFTDRLPESGITFVHGVVDDAAKHYKAAHYDHGTGLALADVEFVITGTLGSRSSAIFDIDDDGDLDIFTNEFNSEPQVLVSELEEKRAIRWLEVTLTGVKSNRDGLGAVVVVKAGGRTLTKVLDGSSGYLSHSRIPLYFGLGDAGQVDAVEVRWPSGVRQSLAGPLSVDRRLVVREEGPDVERR
jgi:hypothetical protein